MTLLTGIGARYEVEDGQRIYSLHGGAEKFWSVTTVISALAKPALMRWAARQVAEAAVHGTALWKDLPPAEAVAALKAMPWKSRDMAARRGLKIHGWVEQLVGGETIEVDEPELEPYLRAFLAWVDDFRPTFLASELTGYHRPWTFAGTCDLIVKVAGALQACVTDVKTGKGVYGEVALQLAGYRGFEFYLDGAGAEVEWPRTAEKGAVLHLKANGSYDFRPVPAGPEMFEVFLALRRLWGWVARDQANVVGDPLRPLSTVEVEGE